MSKVLVVDDEKMICDLLKTVLANCGHEVFTASGGREGLAMFKQHRPDFTMLDLRMPDMHGIEVLKEIRKINPEASVMVLTNWGTDQMEQQARQLGVRDFFSKKMTFDAIAASMERALSPPPPAAAPAAPEAAVSIATPAPADLVPPPAESPVPATQGASILVVDDEPPIRDILWQFLTQRGYRVRTASNGAEALMAVGKESPALIILDIYMPGMTGVEVLRHLYDNKNTSAVLLLTGSQDEKMLVESLNLGVVEILGKPLDLDRLALAVQIGLQIKPV